MNLELYRPFYYAAKSGSISKASEQLFITQPAVSRAIKQLEDSLGCTLFFRTSKGVELTQEGDILFKHIEQAFGLISSAESKINDVRNLITGEVKIGVSDTLCKYYLIPYLKLFNTNYPGVKVHVTCPTTPEIIKLLKAGKIDFGIINMPLKDEQLEFKAVMEIQDCFVAGEKYKHLSGKMLPISEVVKYPLLFLEKSSNTRAYIDEYLKNNSIAAVPDFELGNIDLLIQFAKFDFGIACIIENFAQDILDEGGLYKLHLIEKIPPRNISVAWLKSVPLTSAAKELIRNLEYVEQTEF